MTTVLAEPAVHVLTHQVEEATGGSVKRVLVCMFLSVAVGLAIFLSALRILVPGISLWMYLLPGFGMIAIVAMVPIVAIELLGVLYQAKMRKNTSAQSAQREGGAHE